MRGCLWLLAGMALLSVLSSPETSREGAIGALAVFVGAPLAYMAINAIAKRDESRRRELARLREAEELRRLERAYADTLLALEHDPADIGRRKDALTAGRALAEHARNAVGHGGRTLFDEVQLQNDLSVRIGMGVAATRAERPYVKCHTCAARCPRAARLCAYCGATVSV